MRAPHLGSIRGLALGGAMALVLFVAMMTSVFGARPRAQSSDVQFVLRVISQRLANALPRERQVRVAVLAFAERDGTGATARADTSEELGRLLSFASGGDGRIEIVPASAIQRAAAVLGIVPPIGPSAAPLVGTAVYADYVIVGVLTPSRPGLPGEVSAQLLDVESRRRLSTVSIELVASSPPEATSTRATVR